VQDTLDTDPEFHAWLFSRQVQRLLEDLGTVAAPPTEFSTPGAAQSAVATIEGVLDSYNSCRRQLASVQTLLGGQQESRPAISGGSPEAPAVTPDRMIGRLP